MPPSAKAKAAKPSTNEVVIAVSSTPPRRPSFAAIQPVRAPAVGRKINAVISEAVKTMITMIGR